MPCSGPRSIPARSSTSTAAACARAISAVTVMYAFSVGSVASIRASTASVSAVAVTDPARRASPASTIVSSCSARIARVSPHSPQASVVPRPSRARPSIASLLDVARVLPGPADLPGLNTLTTFRTGGNYWIFVTGPVAWTVTLASSRRSQDRLP